MLLLGGAVTGLPPLRCVGDGRTSPQPALSVHPLKLAEIGTLSESPLTQQPERPQPHRYVDFSAAPKPSAHGSGWEAQPTRGDAEPSRAEEPSSQRLLEAVLEETLAALAANGSAPACLDALRAVASRHAGCPFSLEPVTVALVEAVLADTYQRLFADQDGWRKMVAEVARMLYEDAPAHERLANLWAELCSELP